MKSLDEIRSALKPSAIREAKSIEVKPSKIIAFPSVTLNKRETQFKDLHKALSKIAVSAFGIRNTDVLSGQEMVESRREIALRILWIAARYGSFKKDNLVVDSILINTHKKGTSGFPTTEPAWKRWFSHLTDIGITCEMEFADITKEERTSPIGWLKERIPGTDDPTWFLRISMDKSLGNSSTLKILQEYACMLDQHFENKAFGKFKEIDMSTLF